MSWRLFKLLLRYHFGRLRTRGDELYLLALIIDEIEHLQAIGRVRDERSVW